MGKPQRRFGKEFAAEAVRLVEVSGRTQREIARDLGVAWRAVPRTDTRQAARTGASDNRTPARPRAPVRRRLRRRHKKPRAEGINARPNEHLSWGLDRCPSQRQRHGAALSHRVSRQAARLFADAIVCRTAMHQHVEMQVRFMLGISTRA